MDKVYITGHRNPDTDSIVSAMAYAALKNALGQRQYCAARLGQISDETKAVLDKFGAQPPEVINNVRTQVRDLAYDTPPTLSPGATISRAWQMMQADRISVLPVANEDGTLYGMLSAGDVASYDMLAVRNSAVKNVPVYNLLSVLEGKVLNEGGRIRDEISGEVTIALPAGRENLLFSSQDSIVVCGDQPDMIKRALELRVTCVIVCQAEVGRELLELDTDTCIISTPYDAYRAVHLICHALPIERICKSHDLVFFHQIKHPLHALHRHILQDILLMADALGTPFIGVADRRAIELKHINPITGEGLTDIGQHLFQGLFRVCGGKNLLETLAENAFAAGIIIGRFAHHFPININGDFDAVFSSFVFEHAVFDQIAFVQNRVFMGPGEHLARLQGGIGAKRAGGFDALKNLMAFLAQIFFFVGIA